MADTADLLTTAQVAAALAVSRDRVPRLARTYGVGRRVGRDWLFSAADLAALQGRDKRPGRRWPATNRRRSNITKTPDELPRVSADRPATP